MNDAINREVMGKYLQKSKLHEIAGNRVGLKQ